MILYLLETDSSESMCANMITVEGLPAKCCREPRRFLQKADVEYGAVAASGASYIFWNKVASDRNPSQLPYRTYRPLQGGWSGGKTIAAEASCSFSSKWFRRLTATEIKDVYGSAYAVAENKREHKSFNLLSANYKILIVVSSPEISEAS